VAIWPSREQRAAEDVATGGGNLHRQGGS